MSSLYRYGGDMITIYILQDLLYKGSLLSHRFLSRKEYILRELQSIIQDVWRLYKKAQFVHNELCMVEVIPHGVYSNVL